MAELFLESCAPVVLKNPVADALSGTVTTPWVRLSGCDSIAFAVNIGVATGGTANADLSLQLAKSDAGSGIVDAAFYYRIATGTNSSTAPDVYGAVTRVEAGGVVATGAGSNISVILELSKLADVQEIYSHVRLKSVETVDDPRVASIFAIGYEANAKSKQLPPIRTA
jgi:hypothetical protein